MRCNMRRQLFPVLFGGSTPAIPWYLSGGVAVANGIASYQPKGAASLAASKINLANAATHTLTDGTTPPVFDTAVGWTFTSDWLISDIVPDSINWSVIVRFTGLAAELKALFGCYTSSTRNFWLRNNAGNCQAQQGGAGSYIAPALTTGTYAICGKKVYRDGVNETPDIAAGGTAPSHAIFIGCYNNAGTAAAPITQGSFQAIAFYDTVLSPAQVLAIHTAMMAL